jgi:hypothetical protein
MLATEVSFSKEGIHLTKVVENKKQHNPQTFSFCL